MLDTDVLNPNQYRTVHKHINSAKRLKDFVHRNLVSDFRAKKKKLANLQQFPNKPTKINTKLGPIPPPKGCNLF